MKIRNIEDRIDDGKLVRIKSLVSADRLSRFEQALDLRTRRMVLCLENTYHPHNASATIRTAEAFGIQEIDVVEDLCLFSPSTDIVRGTDKWMDIIHWNSTPPLLDSLKKRGYTIVATSPRPGSRTVENFEIGDRSVALFMGTEKTGISADVEEIADETIYIPMYGLAESLNISVSAAIIMQRINEQIRKQPAEKWKLAAEDRMDLLVNWIASSVRNGLEVVGKILDE